MIATVADLLAHLQQKELELLKKYDIVKHPGIIGDMYEGLTKSILENALFENLNLNVKAGKIRNSKGDLSDEIDCMVVIGEGETIPYTDKSIYESDKVIAVIQVKKNLFSKDLKDSYENLKSVIDVTEERDLESYHTRLLRDCWRSMFKEELPKRNHLTQLDRTKEHIYHLLLLETFYPVRIVWGYNGFASEYSLREKFCNYLSANISSSSEMRYGFGPLNFPSLIICGNNSLFKTNAMPFIGHITEEIEWEFYVSSNKKPVYYLLEVIWSRLQYMYSLSSEIFGEDLEIDLAHRFLRCKYIEIGTLKGWKYSVNSIDKEELELPFEEAYWEPFELNEVQHSIMVALCKNGSIHINDDILNYLQNNCYSLESFVKELRVSGLIDFKDNKLFLISENCVCFIQNNKFYAGDNKSGRVTNWINRQISNEKSKNE